jgi:hypothetical protein
MPNNIFGIVKEVIDECDPCGLLSLGAPDDEYNLESRKIADRIRKDSTADEIAIVMSDVFNTMFNKEFPQDYFSREALDIKNSFDKVL